MIAFKTAMTLDKTTVHIVHINDDKKVSITSSYRVKGFLKRFLIKQNVIILKILALGADITSLWLCNNIA